jgi:glycosyltransferase involved in cell wall biosynthesis
MNEQTFVYVALPAMDEIAVIGHTLNCIRKQTYRNFHLFVCVNQPEVFHSAPAYSHVVESNRKTLEMLNSVNDIPLTVIDRSSPGNGWQEKNHGVGWARKVLFDAILEQAGSGDIVISMDADTQFGERYFESVVEKFLQFPAAVALSNPYYHPLSGDKELDRLMLRYEIYMRYYSLNMWRIGSPYGFTALGSAIAFAIDGYKKISGLAPKFSGEDFYLLQKLRKAGRVIHHNEECVYPATRYSGRVFFGTGPALIKGRAGDWSSYPFYQPELFEKILLLYKDFPLLFEQHRETVADDFIRESFGTEPQALWDDLRKNQPDLTRFVHACHVKFDGLRVLQFLRYFHFKKAESTASANLLYDYLNTFHVNKGMTFKVFKKINFNSGRVRKLNKARDILFQLEQNYRRNDEIENAQMPQQQYPNRWKYLGS